MTWLQILYCIALYLAAFEACVANWIEREANDTGSVIRFLLASWHEGFAFTCLLVMCITCWPIMFAAMLVVQRRDKLDAVTRALTS